MNQTEALFTILTPASIHRAVTYQHCPRRMLLEFDLLGNGIEPVYLDPVKTTRNYLVGAVTRLIATDPLLETIRTVQEALQKDYQTRGVDPEEVGDPYQVCLEQQALTEATLLAFNRWGLPRLASMFDYRAKDGLLEERESGKVYTLTVRVVATAHRTDLVKDVHSLYTVGRGALDLHKHGERYGGTILQYVVVGSREKRKDGKWQRTPLITGYRQKVGGRLAPRSVRKDPRTGAETRLGSDFKAFKLWDYTARGLTLTDWVEVLLRHNELDPLFPRLCVNPPEEREAEEALHDIWEDGEQQRLKPFNDTVEPEDILQLYPMFRHSCDTPTICPMQSLSCCYGDIDWTNPLKGGIYRRKEH